MFVNCEIVFVSIIYAHNVSFQYGKSAYEMALSMEKRVSFTFKLCFLITEVIAMERVTQAAFAGLNIALT